MNIKDILFEEHDPGSLLAARAHPLGHVCALRVTMLDGIQVSFYTDGQEVLDALGVLSGADGPFQTHRIAGFDGDYVIWVEPLEE